ncbi:MAG: hypothetical protein K0V04_33585 [Deltaproteobacteria bacterium]|nr:hypothetical protein [Deltaproteobacteria bacterium]
MSIEFSPRWSFYSWSRGGDVDEESERQLILEMIRNCNSDRLRAYADSHSGGQVYIRTGLHRSATDNREHIQVQLGDSASGTWQSEQWPGYTVHIVYNNTRSEPYEASFVQGLHSGGRRRRR